MCSDCYLLMYKNTQETFTNDIRYRNEIVSIEEDYIPELEEKEQESGISFTQEDLDMIWSTLRKLYPINNTKYILIYLVYYIGLSYRDAADVTGIALSWCHESVEKAVTKLKEELVKNGKLNADSVHEP